MTDQDPGSGDSTPHPRQLGFASTGDPASHADMSYHPVAILDRGQLGRQQALDDALAFREARASAACPDCTAAGPEAKCEDHERDAEMIAGYKRAIQRAEMHLRPVARQARQSPHADGTWP